MDYRQPIWPLEYAPAPHLPPWFKSALAILGGYNLFAQPNLRVVWGMDERGFLNDEPQAPKYMNPRDSKLGWACWMLERFAAPGFYSKVQWEVERIGPDEAGTDKKVDYLGPYPNRGCYIMLAPLIDDDGTGDPDTMTMQPLSQGLLDEIKRRVAFGALKDTNLGIAHLAQQRKRAATAANVDRLLKECKEYYLQNEQAINTMHTRRYSNLTGSRVLPAPDAGMAKQFLATLGSKGESRVNV